MISNFKYSDKTVSCKTPEDLMNANGDFTYAGEGTIEDADYDKIWTYNGIDDEVLRQLEFYHLSSSIDSSYRVKTLVNNNQIYDDYSGLSTATANSPISFRFIKIFNEQEIIINIFAASASNSGAYYYAIYKNQNVFTKKENIYFRAFKNSSYRLLPNSIFPTLNGAVGQNATPFIYAAPLIIYFTDTRQYLKDNTTLYTIQTSLINDSSVPSSSNIFNKSLNLPNWMEIEIDGHKFISLKNDSTSVSHSDTPTLYLRIS